MDGNDGRGGLIDAAARLARDFRGRFDVRTTWMHDGLALVACRVGGASVPGLHTVITPDAEEMRRVLREDGPG